MKKQKTVPRRTNLDHVLIAVRVRSLLPRPIRVLTVRLPLPRTNEYQIVEATWTAPRPVEVARGEFGSTIVFFDHRDVPPGGVRWVFMLVRCRPREFARTAPAKNVIPVPWEVKERCLGRSEGVDPEDPEVEIRAQRFRAMYGDRFQLVQAVNRWIVNDFEYVLDDHQDPAAETLKTHQGSCSELSRLFVAVVRACGIPARFVAGSRRRARLIPYVDVVHHRWVEVFLPHHGWFPIDISANVQAKDPEAAFGRIRGARLVLCRNAGVPNHPFYANSYVLTHPPEGIECKIRSWWLGPRTGRTREMLALLRRGMTGRKAVRRIRIALPQMKPEYRTPFLPLALYPPVDQDDPGWAIRALAATGLRAAVAPLIDYLQTEKREPYQKLAQKSLKQLTTLRIQGADAWRQWLLSPSGLGFLAGKPPQPAVPWTPEEEHNVPATQDEQSKAGATEKTTDQPKDKTGLPASRP